MPVLPLCQIAISSTDYERALRWYRGVFGFVPANRLEDVHTDRVREIQGLPDSWIDVRWLMGQQDSLQVEFFNFRRPQVRPVPADWKPCDIGYASLGIHVADFDATLARIARFGGRPLTTPMGKAGRRRVCVSDPDGILLELMEDNPLAANVANRARPNLPSAATSITISVPDLAQARRFWVDALGIPEATGISLHGPVHESLWGLSGAHRETLLLQAGDFLVELVHYLDPAPRPRPAGWWLADQGISHLAVRPETVKHFDDVYDRAVAAGYRGNCEPVDMSLGKAVYLNDEQGFTLELFYCSKEGEPALGFAPEPDSTSGIDMA